MAARKKVLFVYPPWKPPGGSNAVAVWMIEALKREHALTVLALAPLDVAAINAAYGTRLASSEFETLTVGPLLGAATRAPGRWLLKHSVLLRLARRMAPRFDVCLSANDESDFGRPGIQYIHYPRFDDPRLGPRADRPLEAFDQHWYHRSDLAIRAYFKLAGVVSGLTLDGVRRNLTLVNSDWTGRRVKEVLGIDAISVPPPVPNDFPDVPWAERSDDFVAIGRVAEEKQTDTMIRILRRLRERTDWRGVFRVVGVTEHPEYLARVRRLASECGDWVRLEGELPRPALTRLVAGCRFGIHGMAREHFGIAVAELCNAGCIPFVPDGGGQVEIVGGLQQLLYANEDDGVAKISAIVDDRSRQNDLRTHLAPQRDRYSPERFMESIRRVVAEFRA